MVVVVAGAPGTNEGGAIGEGGVGAVVVSCEVVVTVGGGAEQAASNASPPIMPAWMA